MCLFLLLKGVFPQYALTSQVTVPLCFQRWRGSLWGGKCRGYSLSRGPLKGYLSECPDPSSLFPERGSVSWSLQERCRNSSVQSLDGGGRKSKKTANRSRNYCCVFDSETNFTANNWCFHTQVSELLEED